jgi:hypothetical protein
MEDVSSRMRLRVLADEDAITVYLTMAEVRPYLTGETSRTRSECGRNQSSSPSWLVYGFAVPHQDSGADARASNPTITAASIFHPPSRPPRLCRLARQANHVMRWRYTVRLSRRSRGRCCCEDPEMVVAMGEISCGEGEWVEHRALTPPHRVRPSSSSWAPNSSRRETLRRPCYWRYTYLAARMSMAGGCGSRWGGWPLCGVGVRVGAWAERGCIARDWPRASERTQKMEFRHRNRLGQDWTPLNSFAPAQKLFDCSHGDRAGAIVRRIACAR